MRRRIRRAQHLTTIPHPVSSGTARHGTGIGHKHQAKVMSLFEVMLNAVQGGTDLPCVYMLNGRTDTHAELFKYDEHLDWERIGRHGGRYYPLRDRTVPNRYAGPLCKITDLDFSRLAALPNELIRTIFEMVFVAPGPVRMTAWLQHAAPAYVQVPSKKWFAAAGLRDWHEICKKMYAKMNTFAVDMSFAFILNESGRDFFARKYMPSHPLARTIRKIHLMTPYLRDGDIQELPMVLNGFPNVVEVTIDHRCALQGDADGEEYANMTGQIRVAERELLEDIHGRCKVGKLENLYLMTAGRLGFLGIVKGSLEDALIEGMNYREPVWGLGEGN